MREIKFRAWDGTRFLNKTFFDRNWYNSDNKCVKALVPEDQHYLKIMQYTGLKDKNGKEIYEGDICSVDDGENIYEIIFYMGGFMVAVLPRKIRIYHIGDSLFNNIEIIGNIHENPELLEVK